VKRGVVHESGQTNSTLAVIESLEPHHEGKDLINGSKLMTGTPPVSGGETESSRDWIGVSAVPSAINDTSAGAGGLHRALHFRVCRSESRCEDECRAGRACAGARPGRYVVLIRGNKA